ncbi:MAG: carboxymuconolactone decarboxylase family protein [Actinobacteria bacterium]|nr:carboxymuconolactone decarboxylase family protein [Actinomycetota bacterium]
MGTNKTRVPSAALQELPPALRERLAPRVDRLGYLGEFFVRSAPQPEALCHFIDWTEALKEALPFRMTEAVALTVSCRTGNSYERAQHERLALKHGMTAEEIEAIESGNLASAPGLSDAENAAAALARCVVESYGRGCEPAVIRLARLTDEATAVACLALAGRYLAHATMVNAWGLRPPVSSPFEEPDGRELA